VSRGADIDQLVAGALALEKWPLAQLVRLFEDPRPEGIAARIDAIARLDGQSVEPKAAVLGFTGTPGAGKSSLLGEVAMRLIARDQALAIAVVAVDPSSHRSGGSILGDRTRVHFPAGERRLYFRSQASDQELGGIGRATYPVVRLLERLFDIVFIETVGIGQSEREIEQIAERVYLVLQPMGGDQVQFMKAGIMEVPDVFILNKADVGAAARRSYHMLRASIDFVRPGESELPTILQTSTVTGQGLNELIADIEQHRRCLAPAAASAREAYFFEKWVREEYGRTGLALLLRQGGAAGLLSKAGTFEAAQAAYTSALTPGGS
jgi:LAO/AO transport system kinase